MCRIGTRLPWQRVRMHRIGKSSSIRPPSFVGTCELKWFSAPNISIRRVDNQGFIGDPPASAKWSALYPKSGTVTAQTDKPGGQPISVQRAEQGRKAPDVKLIQRGSEAKGKGKTVVGGKVRGVGKVR